ncbi:MAG: glucokinase [Litorimonas sp.]
MVNLMPETSLSSATAANGKSTGLTLVGDVGGTNCRLALAERTASGGIELHHSERYAVEEYETFNDVVASYLETFNVQPKQGAFAFAGPKFDDEIRMTNLNWIVSEDELRKKFGLKTAVVLNDFVAMANGATVIPDDGFDVLIEGKVDYTKPVAVLGPGTGMGLSCILPGKPVRIIPTEGGHTAFAPGSELERDVLAYWSSRLSFVSAEALLSGPGLVRLHTAICAIMDAPDHNLTAPEIVGAAELDKSSVARITVTQFCSMLGGFAGNVAVTQGASGGVVVGGGVSRHIAKFIPGSEFASRFKDRGPGSWYVKDIPVRLIQANFVPLYGAAAMVLKD